MSKKYKRLENCPHLSAPKVNSEVWNENLLTANRMTDIGLCKIQLLNISALYAITKTCEKVIGRLGKYKMDLSKELLTPLIDALAFFRRDMIRPRLPGRMKQLAKNVPIGSELLFGDDLNKRIDQINNTNNALLTKPSHDKPEFVWYNKLVSYKPAANQTGRYSNGKNTIYQHQNSNQFQNLYPPGKALLLGEGGQAEQQPLLPELKKVSTKISMPGI